MSLTSFLDLKDVKAKFRETFPKPKISSGVMIAPPLTTNYGLVGTAFDYLLRFYLERRCSFAVSNGWIASYAKGLLKPNTISHNLAQQLTADAKQYHATYLTDGFLTDDLLRCCLILAQLDLVFRPGIIAPDLGHVDDEDVRDLRQLLQVVDMELFQPKHLCLLNPIFGIASILVGGADIDLVIDDTLLDIKTTKNSLLDRSHFNQVIGYYILSRIDGVDSAPADHIIRSIAIYSSRYGKFHIFPLDTIGSEQTFAAFTEWFVSRAEQEFGVNFQLLQAFLS